MLQDFVAESTNCFSCTAAVIMVPTCPGQSRRRRVPCVFNVENEKMLLPKLHCCGLRLGLIAIIFFALVGGKPEPSASSESFTDESSGDQTAGEKSGSAASDQSSASFEDGQKHFAPHSSIELMNSIPSASTLMKARSIADSCYMQALGYCWSRLAVVIFSCSCGGMMLIICIFYWLHTKWETWMMLTKFASGS
eukprot:scpid80533/ scgid27901/ 